MTIGRSGGTTRPAYRICRSLRRWYVEAPVRGLRVGSDGAKDDRRDAIGLAEQVGDTFVPLSDLTVDAILKLKRQRVREQHAVNSPRREHAVPRRETEKFVNSFQ